MVFFVGASAKGPRRGDFGDKHGASSWIYLGAKPTVARVGWRFCFCDGLYARRGGARGCG